MSAVRSVVAAVRTKAETERRRRKSGLRLALCLCLAPCLCLGFGAPAGAEGFDPEALGDATAPLTAPAPAPAAREGDGAAEDPGPGVGRVTGFAIPRYVSMKSDKTNLRRGPSRSYRVDWEFLRRGMPVRVVDEHGLWLRIQDHDDVTGWVHRIMISGARTALVTAEGGAQMREAPRGDARPEAMLETGVIGRIDSCRRDWCRLRVDGHDGWVEKTALWGVDAEEEFD